MNIISILSSVISMAVAIFIIVVIIKRTKRYGYVIGGLYDGSWVRVSNPLNNGCQLKFKTYFMPSIAISPNNIKNYYIFNEDQINRLRLRLKDKYGDIVKYVSFELINVSKLQSVIIGFNTEGTKIFDYIIKNSKTAKPKNFIDDLEECGIIGSGEYEKCKLLPTDDNESFEIKLKDGKNVKINGKDIRAYRYEKGSDDMITAISIVLENKEAMLLLLLEKGMKIFNNILKKYPNTIIELKNNQDNQNNDE